MRAFIHGCCSGVFSGILVVTLGGSATTAAITSGLVSFIVSAWFTATDAD